ncbi:GNAT family N-acetyltransferase [Amycolatopsis sulphurea]|uniref:GNAT family N-acetyltransferase n=1 Tax=Amycolatopsis sulphurea TaxID=76022 RepID=UPI0031840F64
MRGCCGCRPPSRACRDTGGRRRRRPEARIGHGCAAGSEYAEGSHVGEPEFRMLAVAGKARGRGIGAALTRAVLDPGTCVGVGKVLLSSLAQMRTAQRLYERIGFSRLPGRDWRPEPGVSLIADEYDL